MSASHVHPDEQLAALATAQHGLVTLGQARWAGLTEKGVRHRLEQGRWVQLRRRVYALAGSAPTWEREVLAVVLAAGGAAWASHLTAARLWELIDAPPARIEIVTPIERQVRLTGVRAHRSGFWHEHDIGVVHDIPVTSPSRTIVDLSNRVEEESFNRMVDDAMRRGILSLVALARCVERFDIAPGRSPTKLRSALAERTPGMHLSESQLESRVLRLLAAEHLPLPTPQYEVTVAGRRFRIDLAYPQRRIAIEVDGFDFHRTRTVFDRDRDRQNLLVLAGWTVLRFTSRTSDDEIVRTVRHALFVQ